jgi:hypothetical protein
MLSVCSGAAAPIRANDSGAASRRSWRTNVGTEAPYAHATRETARSRRAKEEMRAMVLEERGVVEPVH